MIVPCSDWRAFQSIGNSPSKGAVVMENVRKPPEVGVPGGGLAGRSGGAVFASAGGGSVLIRAFIFAKSALSRLGVFGGSSAAYSFVALNRSIEKGCVRVIRSHFFRDDAELEMAGAGAAEFLGDRDAEKAHLGKALPQILVIGGIAVEHVAHRLGRALFGEEFPRFVAHLLLFVGEIEVHVRYLCLLVIPGRAEREPGISM